MPSDKSLPLVGVYHAAPEPYLPLIRELLPDSNLRLCKRWDGIEEILDGVDVLLAFKFGCHRTLKSGHGGTVENRPPGGA
jgi:hypothetical protein